MTTLTGTYCPGGDTPSSEKDRKIVRCPACNRRLLLAEVHCIGGELLGYRIPAHKPKTKTTKKTARKAQ